MTLVMDTNVEDLLVAYHREGDQEARERALVELMPLVRALATRYAGRGEPLEDLVQVGSIGLIKAVDRFDVDRGVDFASYAVPTIVGENVTFLHALADVYDPQTIRANLDATFSDPAAEYGRADPLGGEVFRTGRPLAPGEGE